MKPVIIVLTAVNYVFAVVHDYWTRRARVSPQLANIQVTFITRGYRYFLSSFAFLVVSHVLSV